MKNNILFAFSRKNAGSGKTLEKINMLPWRLEEKTLNLDSPIYVKMHIKKIHVCAPLYYLSI